MGTPKKRHMDLYSYGRSRRLGSPILRTLPAGVACSCPLTDTCVTTCLWGDKREVGEGLAGLDVAFGGASRRAHLYEERVIPVSWGAWMWETPHIHGAFPGRPTHLLDRVAWVGVPGCEPEHGRGRISRRGSHPPVRRARGRGLGRPPLTRQPPTPPPPTASQQWRWRWQECAASRRRRAVWGSCRSEPPAASGPPAPPVPWAPRRLPPPPPPPRLPGVWASGGGGTSCRLFPFAVSCTALAAGPTIPSARPGKRVCMRMCSRERNGSVSA